MAFNLRQFNALVGQDSYVRCLDKKRIDTAIVNEAAASAHIFNGGQIGWWVRPGYIIVDIDEGKEEALKVVKKLGLKTLMAQTPKGLHLYFKTTKDFPQKIGMVLPCGLKCDFRCAQKGYVILPFGTKDRKFNKIREVAELPMEFTPMPTRKDSLLGLKEGDGRNATLFAHLMAYKNRGADNDQIDTMAEVINKVIFDQPMNDDELSKIVHNTYKYEAQIGGDNPYLIYNSKGNPSQVNARAIVDYFVNKGDTFILGDECYSYRDGVYEESSSTIRNNIRDMIMDDALITQGRIMECYRLLVDDTRLQRRPDELNADENLINFRNGVWDIKQKKLLPHDSKYLSTIQIPHSVGEYVPFKYTKLYDFLKKKAKLPKEDIVMALQYLAYCMTLGAGLKTFLVLLGKSNTGKSVLIRFVENLIGHSNVSNLSIHELNMRFYPAQLYGKLLNSCADNGSLPLSSIENLKKITGNDMIMHEKKGKDPFFFVPFSKLLLSFNQMPLQLEEKSNAFYKRMRILYMNKELFLNDAYVNALCSRESIEEIIPYLLKLLPVQSIGRPEMSEKLVEALRRDSDTIHDFIVSCCDEKETLYAKKDMLYDTYAQFCIENGREAHKKHNFMRTMRAQGYIDSRYPKTREAAWKGIGLKPVEVIRGGNINE